MDDVVLVGEEKANDPFCAVLRSYINDLNHNDSQGQKQEQAVTDHVHNVVDPTQGQNIEDETAAEEKSRQVWSDLFSGEGWSDGGTS